MAKLKELLPGQSPTSADFSFGDNNSEGDGFVDDPVPELFTGLPLIRDALETPTSVQQDAVVNECIGFMAGLVDGDFNDLGVRRLIRPRHVRFLNFNLARLPSGFVAADSSRPWLLYWSLAALTLLGEDVSAKYRDRLVETARSMRNDSGGFGPGSGQLSHLATTYAIVLSVALVGGEEAYEAIDRRALWKWLGLLKCPDGGFRMCIGGEEDIRGAYCAAVIISLLDLPLDLPPNTPAKDGLAAFSPTPNLLTGLGDYVRRCQTFEGGISGQPDAEAHGAYAFCALGCLAIIDSPRRIIPKYLDVPRLIAWLSSRQYAPEGGFSGRTNKLVDGCYSHWVGGCWPLVEACLNEPDDGGPETAAARAQNLAPCDGSLYSREGLIRYILCCCQDDSKRGGLRDKPNKPSDAYHSCYVLSGLSSAQHTWRASRPEHTTTTFTGSAQDTTAVTVDNHTCWTVEPCEEPGANIFDEEDRIPTAHPVYTIPPDAARDIKAYFSNKQGF